MLWGWDPLSSLFSQTEGWLSLWGKDDPSRGKAEGQSLPPLLAQVAPSACPQTVWVQPPGQALPASLPANHPCAQTPPVPPPGQEQHT